MSTQPTADPELVDVFATEQVSEAMVVHGLLTASGIESVIIYLESSPDFAPVGGAAVRVNAAQADEARKMIEDYKANAAAAEDGDTGDDDEDQDKV